MALVRASVRSVRIGKVGRELVKRLDYDYHWFDFDNAINLSSLIVNLSDSRKRPNRGGLCPCQTLPPLSCPRQMGACTENKKTVESP